MLKPLSQPLEDITESIFTTMSSLAHQHQAINLSQGFPNFDDAYYVLENVKKYFSGPYNQYSMSIGHPLLRKNLAKFYSGQYNRTLNPDTEVTITNGATEAIFLSIKAITNPEDELIFIAPFYDSYLDTAKMARCTVKEVHLEQGRNLDFEKMEKLITNKTKAIILNTPHNPTGKVFTKEEIDRLKSIILKHDLYLISDEVYEFILFDQLTHHSPFDDPEIRDRVICISSSSKTFGLTGWKVGWVFAEEKISAAIRKIHQANVFCVAHPLQMGVADSLLAKPEYYQDIKVLYQKKRDQIIEGLRISGLDPIVPQGTYFIIASVEGDDVEHCNNLITNKKVAAIPTSAFYIHPPSPRFVRFCFAKTDDTLKEAINRLKC